MDVGKVMLQASCLWLRCSSSRPETIGRAGCLMALWQVLHVHDDLMWADFHIAITVTSYNVVVAEVTTVLWLCSNCPATA